jgi:hypothetical protein
MESSETALQTVLDFVEAESLEVPLDLLRQIYEAEARVQFLDDDERGNVAMKVAQMVRNALAANRE